mgnify:FL=1
MKNVKNGGLILGIIGALVILAGGTYAYYKWSSTTNIDVSITVNGSVVTFNGDAALVGNDLIPVASKDEGLRKDITVKATKTGSTMSLFLDLTTMPAGLKDSTFKYELVKTSGSTATTKKSGNFGAYNASSNANGISYASSGVTQITLLTDEPVATTEEKYSLYLWIDGESGDNSSAMQNQTFSFNLSATGKGAILNQ